MYRLTLKKIESTHNNVRNEPCHGIAPELPRKGKGFFMYAETRNMAVDREGKPVGYITRFINTSQVQGLIRKENGVVLLQTENSLYALENIKRITVAGGKETAHEVLDSDFDDIDLTN